MPPASQELIEQYLAPLRVRLHDLGHRITSISHWYYQPPIENYAGKCSFWIDGHIEVAKADGHTYKLYIRFQHYSDKQAFFTANVEGLAQKLFAGLYPEYTVRKYYFENL